MRSSPHRPLGDPALGASADSGASDSLLARSVIHELRQDLSLVVGYAELLVTRQLSESERAAMVAVIREAAAGMADVLRRLDCPEPPGRVRLGPEELLDLRSPGAPVTPASPTGHVVRFPVYGGR